jgi:hypothetical protein
MVFKNAKIEGMGSEEGSEFKLRTVDPERVKKHAGARDWSQVVRTQNVASPQDLCPR